jgi:hypothetical protein
VYSGVRLDGAILAHTVGLDGGSSADDSAERLKFADNPVYMTALGAYTFLCIAIDLPLSAVGDTLSLPITINWWLENRRRARERPPPDDPDARTAEALPSG